MLDGPPMKKPVVARITAFMTLSLGEPERFRETGGWTLAWHTLHVQADVSGAAGAKTHGCIPPGRPLPSQGWKPAQELSSPWSQISGPEGSPLPQTHSTLHSNSNQETKPKFKKLLDYIDVIQTRIKRRTCILDGENFTTNVATLTGQNGNGVITDDSSDVVPHRQPVGLCLLPPVVVAQVEREPEEEGVVDQLQARISQGVLQNEQTTFKSYSGAALCHTTIRVSTLNIPDFSWLEGVSRMSLSHWGFSAPSNPNIEIQSDFIYEHRKMSVSEKSKDLEWQVKEQNGIMGSLCNHNADKRP